MPDPKMLTAFGLGLRHRNVMLLHSPLLKQSQLLSLPAPTDMLKFRAWLHTPPGRETGQSCKQKTMYKGLQEN